MFSLKQNLISLGTPYELIFLLLMNYISIWWQLFFLMNFGTKNQSFCKVCNIFWKWSFSFNLYTIDINTLFFLFFNFLMLQTLAFFSKYLFIPSLPRRVITSVTLKTLRISFFLILSLSHRWKRSVTFIPFIIKYRINLKNKFC